MKPIGLICLVALTLILASGGAFAACYAEYKAKRDNPLELIYNVAQLRGPCTLAAARAQLSADLAAQGITLLKVLSVSQD